MTLERSSDSCTLKMFGLQLLSKIPAFGKNFARMHNNVSRFFMRSIRLPRLVRGHTFARIGLNSYQRSYAKAGAGPGVYGASWRNDPTYHKIHAPNSIQWTMPTIPKNIRRPHYSETGGVSPWSDIIPLALPIGPAEWYDEYLAEGMRNAGRCAAESLQYAVSLVKPGITTREIDREITEWAFSHHCYPSSLNYGQFAGSLCTSVNNVISHGVPNEYPS
jgi:hypothetical protein